jgi:hypothetical protein
VPFADLIPTARFKCCKKMFYNIYAVQASKICACSIGDKKYKPSRETKSEPNERRTYTCQLLALKVMSSENKGGFKILLIVGYWPGTVALDNSLKKSKPSRCVHLIPLLLYIGRVFKQVL